MSSRVTFQDSIGPSSGDSTPRLAAPIDIPIARSTMNNTTKSHNNRNTSQSPPNTTDQQHGDRRRRGRKRAESTSSADSQSADSTSASPATPPGPARSDSGSPVEVATSPILSYFLADASPIKSAAHFSFNKERRKSFGNSVSNAGAVFEEDEEDGSGHQPPPVFHHARRVSTSWAQSGTIGINQKGPITESQQERNNSLFRRLSLSGARPTLPAFNARFAQTQSAFAKSPTSPGSSPPLSTLPPRRSATISTGTGQKIHRPPSPMGERMLKGDFSHGF